MSLSWPMAETVLRSPRNRKAMLIPPACLRVSHSCTAHVCLSLCVGMRSYVSVVWAVVRRERDRTHVCTESNKGSKTRWPRSVQTRALSRQRRGSSPEVPRGSCTQCLKFLPPHSLCFGHLPCEGKGLTGRYSVLKEQKYSYPEWFIRPAGYHIGLEMGKLS